MNESKRLKKLRPPTGRTESLSGGAAEQADATMDLTTPERPLHEYLAAVCERTNVRSGMPLPLRTYACGEGVNVVFVNRHAGRVRLGLFDYPHDAMAARVVNLAESTRSCSD